MTAPTQFDEQRLRAALEQLAAGLAALHAAGKIHRDIKPSNVLVASEGRLVLLDFGLATGFGRDDRSAIRHAVGTIASMAPEQAACTSVGPPADIYAAGVMLYQALTGELPFDGPPIEVMLRKQTCDGPSSGFGKTSLVRHFLETLRLEVPDVVVLSGRCYEREHVPFRAVDGVVDALCRFMVQLDDVKAAELLPRAADLYLATSFSLSILNTAWLFLDDTLTARRMIEDALPRWSFQGSVVHAWYAPTARAQLALYEGDGKSALSEIEQAWPKLAQAFLLRAYIVHCEARSLRARALIAASQAQRDHALLARAERDATWLQRRGVLWIRALGALALAGALEPRGNRARSLALLQEAERDFEAASIRLYAHVTRRARGKLLGGDAGAQLVADAERWMSEEGIVRPDRIAAMLAPGLGE